MKREERRQAIMDLLIAARAVDLDDLAGRFAVSKMTIHRDLDDLEQTGLLRKVRGGATVEAGIQFESDFRIRALQDAGAKARMAAAALHLVEPGMSVMVNDGSMAALLGTRLVERAPLTIITNNAAVIETLKDAPRITLIALGGAFDAKFNGFFGVVTEQALSRLRADLAFISTPAVSGLRAFHMSDAVVGAKRAMMDAAQRRVLLVNHARFGRSALHELAGLAEFDAIITDAPPAPEDRAAIDRAGLTLTIAED
ncbi:MAG: DeoR/GlpR family DNA-binding transcription regulator [Paracoccus sp. (in: a-proteobacteria)]|jgi:DeoR/GlpR family transcriptional regulator of sugar metabolism|uniref:DeoR/GlpR family DNA-binding transcription regulator n=2 Tax=Paracoccus TaxID=265 RepID=UPI000C4061FE|nr:MULTISPECIES: DeoR/GlpR family DNA-binding transcription regulator [unclassified Paracoccus (in: a-proteobacteria)]MBA48731.1 DeoR family transcriptional regulator [Paracoccus sp. (in: a-proteobacteria)]HIC66555.1 DeoR/GlpR transcriptional regulator [Paracoccus sp. (in: a-proteobacteria)]|tara:strand:- start:15180 stop:15944 length:765 start_codon:yes stop_codon:yes gene_type:complete